MLLAKVFNKIMIVMHIREAFVEFMTILIKFAPHIEEILSTKEVFVMSSAMYDDSINDLKLLYIELT